VPGVEGLEATNGGDGAQTEEANASLALPRAGLSKGLHSPGFVGDRFTAGSGRGFTGTWTRSSTARGLRCPTNDKQISAQWGRQLIVESSIGAVVGRDRRRTSGGTDGGILSRSNVFGTVANVHLIKVALAVIGLSPATARGRDPVRICRRAPPQPGRQRYPRGATSLLQEGSPDAICHTQFAVLQPVPCFVRLRPRNPTDSGAMDSGMPES
jgi:hypothetical protein